MQKENIFIHKILPILSILILVSFIFINNNVFASNISVDISSIVNDSVWCIFLGEDGNYYLAVGINKGSDCFMYESNTYLRYRIDISGGAWLNYDLYIFDSSNYEFVYHSSQGFNYSGVKEFIYSSKDIKIERGSSDVFFQQTPVLTSSILIQVETSLAQELEKVEMTQEITTTIVGLAKLLIPLLICLLGFCKAWQLLSRLLHKA